MKTPYSVFLLTFDKHFERWIACTPSSLNVFLTLATQQHLEYHYKAFFETPYIKVA
jgi:hypothetical protein